MTFVFITSELFYRNIFVMIRMKPLYKKPQAHSLVLMHECMLHEISTRIGQEPATEADEGGRAKTFGIDYPSEEMW